MRKFQNLTWLLGLGVALMFLTACDKETVLTPEKAPDEISQFISTHFPDHEILQIIKDRDDFNLSYDVILEGGISLEFNRKKEITDIDSSTELPDSVIPEKILQYVRTNFPENFIKGWELEDRHQQVELNNGLDLEFNMNGEFIRIDD